ncbi:hypothetical protein FEM48_Zijuj12G0129300 [Ziziphus jujuba var. spinosa]|uniref:Alpha/beta hydrolase fold-3 domain-containing protein n=1 Tax=Ziziphus jujuba var. spinosa TaxID=714518 RepID=A0A978UDG5_ZIZJJ|nr:hypothetical protein FEM48_Zijuj12G0129300 [Ziziphus jujuba var. spinosa]
MTFNAETKTWVRIYRPTKLPSNDNAIAPLPIIIYFHRGGWISSAPPTPPPTPTAPRQPVRSRPSKSASHKIPGCNGCNLLASIGAVEDFGYYYEPTDVWCLSVLDVMWDLVLTKGSNRDHRYCNPIAKGAHRHMIGRLAWTVFDDWFWWGPYDRSATGACDFCW